MLGGVRRILSCPTASGPLRWERFIQRGVAMDVQIAHDQGDTGCLRIIFLHQPPNALRPLLGGMIIRYVDATPILEGGIKRQQVGDAIPFVFHVSSVRSAPVWPVSGHVLRARIARWSRPYAPPDRPDQTCAGTRPIPFPSGTRRPHSQARECTTSASARV